VPEDIQGGAAQTSDPRANIQQGQTWEWYDQIIRDFQAYIANGGDNLGSTAGALLQPIHTGMAQAGALLNDPYNIPEARLNSMLENTELAYNRAGNEARQQTLGSGAGRGGVARLSRGNIEQARGADQARNIREFEQFRTARGDSIIQNLLPSLLSQYNNSEAISRGGQQQSRDGGSSTSDYLELAAQALAIYYGVGA
jgi:hypothetical protein